MKIRSAEDFWSGLMFIGFGLLAVFVARDYPMGSAMRMGPGYFPTYLGAILMAVGAMAENFPKIMSSEAAQESISTVDNQ